MPRGRARIPAVYFDAHDRVFREPAERTRHRRALRGLARCARSRLRAGGSTPDHSSLSVIRGSSSEIYQAAFERLAGLRARLLKGRNLGIDSSVIEANASLRELVHRNTEEQYWEYVKRLAAEASDPGDTRAVRRFDKKREAEIATSGSTRTTPTPRWA
ncbi:MAG: hypothetical protein R3F11_22765 [Verrucomicrobiales bacterium]